MNRLAGKTAIVTGAGRGIGQAIAHSFAAEGAKVILISRNPASCGSAADAINAEFPGSCKAFPCDVADAAAVDTCIKEILAEYPAIDILVNNAGITKDGLLIFSPLYILASFVKDKVSICVWIYLWAFYFVPLIYIYVFVPVPYCLDDCGFVVEPEVRQVESSSSVFFLKIALAIRGFLYFHTNCEIICSSSVKNTAGTSSFFYTLYLY